MRNNKFTQLFLALTFAIVTPLLALGAGPLFMFDEANRIPYRYDVTSPVAVYTDLGPLRTLTPAISNERADELTAFSVQQWTDVETSSFQAQVVGDFASLGLPDINSTNAGLILGTDNGGGIHVIYDTDGSILQNFFGASPITTLGIASPEWAIPDSPVLTESWVVLNGRGVSPTDPTGIAFDGVITHEFGHSINLAHTQVNGAIGFYADNTGPAGCASLPYSGVPTVDDTETMYPFLNTRLGTGGSGLAQSTVNQLDDKVSLSKLYPAPGWSENTGSISGKLFTPDGKTEVPGVNLIARNLDNPFSDAVSGMSGDYTRGANGTDGSFTINGLTPGGRYVIYADAIRAGGFPTAQPNILPGPEEFFNGLKESGDGVKDNPCQAEPVTAVPGNTATANIEFNRVKNGPTIEIIQAPGALATDISGDGKTVVGSINGDGAPSWKWDKQNGFQTIGGRGGIARISQEGNYITANSFASDNTPQVYAAIWLGGNDWQPLPPVENPGTSCSNSAGPTTSSSSGIARNGKAVTGLAYDGSCAKPRAFLWTETEGSKILPVPDNTRQANANNISADGSTVVGWRNLTNSGVRRGGRWVNGVFEQFGTDTVVIGEATSVNPDGSVIVGQIDSRNGAQAWRWTAETGVQPIGTLSTQGVALDLSDNGNVVVGFSGSSSRLAFIWMPETGMLSLDAFLAAQGTALGNNPLFTPTAISSDGTRITGWGPGPNNYYPWVVDISKVVVSHAPPGNPENVHNLVVDFRTLPEHLAHGDTIGLTFSND